MIELGSDAEAFRTEASQSGLRWIEVFRTFPSLRGKLFLSAAVQLMGVNHPRWSGVQAEIVRVCPPWVACEKASDVNSR